MEIFLPDFRIVILTTAQSTVVESKWELELICQFGELGGEKKKKAKAEMSEVTFLQA